jgi:hypothetical protein
MTRKHVPHAQHVVEAFKAKLSDSGRQHVGDRHFDELALLVESAISTAVLETMEHTADSLVTMAEKLRKEAEHI